MFEARVGNEKMLPPSSSLSCSLIYFLCPFLPFCLLFFSFLFSCIMPQKKPSGSDNQRRQMQRSLSVLPQSNSRLDTFHFTSSRSSSSSVLSASLSISISSSSSVSSGSCLSSSSLVSSASIGTVVSSSSSGPFLSSSSLFSSASLSDSSSSSFSTRSSQRSNIFCLETIFLEHIFLWSLFIGFAIFLMVQTDGLRATSSSFPQT